MAIKKLTLAALLLAALLALQATATTYTTTVTTTTIDDDNNQARCQGQIQGRRFQSCQRYLTSRPRRSQEADELLEMSTENPREQEQPYLSQCCQELRNVHSQCRCDAIRHAVRQTQQQGPGSYQGEQVYQKARSLPQTCNMESPTRCDIRPVFL